MALKVKPNALKKRSWFVDSITTAFNGLDFVIETFDKATGKALLK